MTRKKRLIQRERRSKWFLLTLACLGVVGVIGTIGWNRRQGESESVTQLAGPWLGSAAYRFIVLSTGVDEPVYMVEYIPPGKTLVVVQVPVALVMPAAGGLGNYRLGSLLSLGEQEGMGTRLITTTMMQQLGISIRSIVVRNTTPSDADLSRVAYQGTNQLLVASLWQKDLHFTEAVKIWWGVRQTEPSKRLSFRLDLTQLSTKDQDVDGEILHTFNPELWDAWWDEIHSRLVIINETVSVAIENTTDVSGLASTVGRILARDGFEVITVTDGRLPLPRTVVMVEEPELLKQALIADSRWLFPEADWRVGRTDERRSQIVIRIGQYGQGVWNEL